MIWINTTYRTQQAEVMDDFALEGDILKDALDKIAKINQWLGGNQLTLQGVKGLLKNINTTQEITLIDIGCGNGDMLRTLAEYGQKNGMNLKLIGIDANNFTINHAKQLSTHHSNIYYSCMDVFQSAFLDLEYDIALCTLTLHHFKEDEIRELLTVIKERAKIGIVINDLQRSALAYRLFQIVCLVFNLNDMSREDGLVSILRGFKRKELVTFSKQLQLHKYTIQWKWAFRYQWIIKTKQ